MSPSMPISLRTHGGAKLEPLACNCESSGFCRTCAEDCLSQFGRRRSLQHPSILDVSSQVNGMVQGLSGQLMQGMSELAQELQDLRSNVVSQASLRDFGQRLRRLEGDAETMQADVDDDRDDESAVDRYYRGLYFDSDGNTILCEESAEEDDEYDCF